MREREIAAMGTVKVFAGTEKGGFIFESDEARKDWTVSEPVLAGWKVQDITIDPRDGNTLYAAVSSWVYGPCIQVSKDGGKTWTQLENGPAYAEDAGRKLTAVWTVAPARDSEPDTLYAGVAEAGLFVSRDKGGSWEELSLNNHPTREEWSPGAGGLCCHTIIFHPSDPNRMWVAISAVGVFRTDDGGKTWNVKNVNLPIAIEGKQHKEVGSCVHRMVIDPTNPNRLYQQNHMGLYATEDGGDTWEVRQEGLPSDFGFPMVMHPHDPNTLYVVPQISGEYRYPKDGQMAVYRSSDAARGWHPLTDGLPANAYTGVMRQAMATDTCEDAGIYFGTTAGDVFYSRDNGDHWDALPGTLPRIASIKALYES